MCGIVGIVRFDGRPVQPRRDRRDDRQHPAPRSRRRRGAGRGRRRHRHAAPLDRRPEPAAATSRCSTRTSSVAVVFNGEIYNHRDIRSRLEAERPRLSRAPATPRCWSTATSSSAPRELAARLAGMFAFALLRSPAPAAVPRPRRVRDQAALPAADGAPALVRVGDPGAGARRPGRRCRSIRASRTRSCASATSRRRRPRSRASIKLAPGTLLRDRSRRPARSASRRSIAWRPPRIDDTRPGRAARAAARAAERVGAPAPDGGRADGAVSVGRARLERADVVREPPRRAAQDVLDRVFVLGSGRRDRVRRGGRAPRRQRERAHRSRARQPRRSRSDRRRARGAAGRQRRAAALVPVPRHRRAREGRAVRRGRRRGARRLRPLFLGPGRRRPAARSCCAHAAQVLRRRPAGCRRDRWASSTSRAAPRSSPTRSPLDAPARYLSWFDIFTRRRAARAGRRRATTARRALRGAVRGGARRCGWIRCSASSTSTSRRCCSTTC